MLQPFTWCDPDDQTAETATSTAACTTTPENNGPDINPDGNIETRASNTLDPFDNVNDYNGLSTITNMAGGGSAKYTANVTITPTSLNGIAASDSLLINVSVNSGSETITLQGYRTRFSPNAKP